MAALAAAGTVPASGAINGTDARAYFQRGVAMYNDKNYDGCIDQLLQMRHLDPTAADREDAHYYLAMSTLYCGDDEALDMLNAFLSRYPESPRYQDALTSVGDYYFTRGSYGDALLTYKQVEPEALTADRLDDLRYRMAYSYMMLGEYDNALPLFDALMQSRQYSNAARFYKAYIAYSRRDYAEARRLFADVDQSREPGNAARYYLCQLDFLDGHYEQAYNEASALLRANAVKEFDPELRRIAGESLYNLGRTEQAIPYLRQYIATGTDIRPSAYYMLGVSEYEGGNYADAINMLQMATGDEDITGQSAYLYLGQSYLRTGDTNAAILAFDKASRMNYDQRITEAASYNYIASRMAGGRVPFANSVTLLEDFLKKYPQSAYAPAVSESLVTGYMTDSDYDNALRILNGIKNPTPQMLRSRQQVLFMLGTRLYHNGDTEQALDYFTQGADMAGGIPELTRQCRLWAANANYDLGNYDEAAADYLAFLREAPADDANLTDAYYNLGYTRMHQQRYDDALTDMLRVAENTAVDARTRADAYNRAADCLYCQRQFDRAAGYYTKAYDLCPQAGDYPLFQLAEMSGYRRDYAKRISTLDRMTSLFPSSPLVPDALLAKAESLAATGRHREAGAVYESVSTDYAATAQGRRAALMLAVSRLDEGDRNGAMDAYRAVVERYPSSDEARSALDDLKQLYADEGRLPDYVLFVNSVDGISKVEISQFEAEAFTAAEDAFLNDRNSMLLKSYVKQFADGANLPQALLYLAEEASDNDNAAEAAVYATRIADLFPDKPQAEEALLIKAESEAALGKGEAALATYRKLESRASSAELLNAARLGIVETAISAGRYDEVLPASEKLISSSAANADLDRVKFYRALALDRTGRSDEAYELWRALAKNPSTLTGSKSAVYLTESLTAAGRLDEAKKTANDFIDAGSPHNYWYARGFIAYSDVLRRQGKTFEADEYLKALRDNYPGQEADIFEMIDSRLSGE